jgi:hypothetical protein
MTEQPNALRLADELEREEKTAHCSTDCRSEIGVTVGLIDALIAIARVLALRDLSPRDVREALADLQADEDLARVLAVVPGDLAKAEALDHA